MCFSVVMLLHYLLERQQEMQCNYCIFAMKQGNENKIWQ